MNIIIINNAAKDSTVLSAFLPIACDKYTNVKVVFPAKIKENNIYKKCHADLCAPSMFNKIRAFGRLIMTVMSRESFGDFRTAKEQQKLSFKFLLSYIKCLYIACVEYVTARSELCNLKGKTIVFSMWYAENAIAAAILKKHYPDIIAASYAHSYEVDPIKNRHVGLFSDRFKEKYLDAIYFISETVMSNYLQYNKKYVLFPQKYKSIHFGSEKKIDMMCNPSSDGVFRILTCSGLSSVKRLDVLAEALLRIKSSTPIIWSVLGDGPMKDRIKSISSQYNGHQVKAVMYGAVDNITVHKYYVENPVDLFVNISSSEGLPVSIMEAMSYGVPTLATDVGGNREIVNDETGLLLKADVSPNDVAEALCALMSDDLNSKRKAASAMWQANYQIENNVLRLFSDLEQL